MNETQTAPEHAHVHVQETPIWWGESQVQESETRWWALGSLLVGVQRKAREWRVGHEHFNTGEAILPVSDRPVDDLKTATRFVYAQPGERIKVIPALADRPVVTRPMSPLYLPPGEETILFVSSQVWVQMEAVELKTTLLDVPSVQPSETWFGPSTLDGEICYATKTHGRLLLEDLPLQPYRAVTPLEIINESAAALKLERVSLPVPNLTLYASDSGSLWTQKIIMRCGKDSQHASLKIKKRAPYQADNPVVVASPRQVLSERVLVRAFSTFFN